MTSVTSCVQVQHGVISCARVELGLPDPVIMHMCQIAAQSLASEALLKDFLTTSVSPYGTTIQGGLARSGGSVNHSLGLL
jgi:hypothetical protein